MATAEQNYNDLYQTIDYVFKDLKLIEQALTHSSVYPKYASKSYERLEFLGDRVLGLIISELLFQTYLTDSEGDLAKRLAYLVSKKMLLKVAGQLQLSRYVRLGRGVQAYDEVRRLSLQADACEALIAALYLEGGLVLAQKFVQKFWMPLIQGLQVIPQDAKSCLQEWSQEHHQVPPVYKIVNQFGPAHAPLFIVEASVKGHVAQCAEASSKREAEQLAASKILEKIKLL